MCWVLCSPNILFIGFLSRVGSALGGYLAQGFSQLPLLYKGSQQKAHLGLSVWVSFPRLTSSGRANKADFYVCKAE